MMHKRRTVVTCRIVTPPPPDEDPTKLGSSNSNIELTIRVRMTNVAVGAVIGARRVEGGECLDKLKSLTGCTRLVIMGVKGGVVWTLIAWVPNGSVADEIKNLVRAIVKAFKTGVEGAVRRFVAKYIPVRQRKTPVSLVPMHEGSESCRRYPSHTAQGPHVSCGYRASGTDSGCPGCDPSTSSGWLTLIWY
jgi:hypothetical protein